MAGWRWSLQHQLLSIKCNKCLTLLEAFQKLPMQMLNIWRQLLVWTGHPQSQNQIVYCLPLKPKAQLLSSSRSWEEQWLFRYRWDVQPLLQPYSALLACHVRSHHSQLPVLRRWPLQMPCRGNPNFWPLSFWTFWTLRHLVNMDSSQLCMAYSCWKRVLSYSCTFCWILQW